MLLDPVRFNVNENFSNENVSNKLQPLRNYRLNYGDKLEIYHGHPIRFLINGKVIDAREDYEDGVDNPENLINTTFEITKSGLKAIYTNPDTSNITENKVVFGPMAPEKFPVKIQIDFRERKFKVLDKTEPLNFQVVIMMMYIGWFLLVQMGQLKEIHLLEGIRMPILLMIASFGIIKRLIIMTVYIYGTKIQRDLL